MKSKQVLDVQQMQHLQELGLKLEPSLVHYYKIINIDSGKWYLSVTTGNISEDSPTYQYIPAYTLQDVLDALPYSIECDKGDVYWLQIEKMDMKNDDWRVSYLIFSQYKYFHCFQSPHLIDAAYELLVWCIENKFVETNKNE